MTNKEAKSLFKKYRSGHCTPEEIAMFESWYNQYARLKRFRIPNQQQMDDDLEDVWQELQLVQTADVLKRRSVRLIASASAAAVLLIGLLFLFWDRMPAEEEQFVVSTEQVGEQDGVNEAYIELSDGKVISLDRQRSGNLYKDGSAAIHKEDGRISVETLGGRIYALSSEDEVEYNTIVVPRGRQYELMLSDGSKVWLNSQSSIRFPLRFGRNDRQVEITGEAYFEIAPEAHRPFFVRAGGQQVKVLGTHFNINAYEDEPIVRTTLLEGKVEVSVLEADKNTRAITRVLHPGQESRFTPVAKKLNVVAVDSENAIAWKSGLILFEGSTIEAILRQASRWYDFEVEFIGESSNRRFTGGVSRNAPLSEFLRVLEINDIRFTYNERTLRIYNIR